jgi:hypothetical protein
MSHRVKLKHTGPTTQSVQTHTSPRTSNSTPLPTHTVVHTNAPANHSCTAAVRETSPPCRTELDKSDLHMRANFPSTSSVQPHAHVCGVPACTTHTAVNPPWPTYYIMLCRPPRPPRLPRPPKPGHKPCPNSRPAPNWSTGPSGLS